ncbi:hypothetical protein RFI_11310 [Reticulomyxa filosa]|uniref:Uncharacterized protein n=1 Tax=Reticulomyxa filosa TaxID=46433 RepID=X6NIU2_RETFI|nr:hypothetical protein RFI_11310 [Reticulomyxa filosa]|eukprot:ETO25823.1 hypothetical protein RFI_11310 [Reticulomyxa filosa]
MYYSPHSKNVKKLFLCVGYVFIERNERLESKNIIQNIKKRKTHKRDQMFQTENVIKKQNKTNKKFEKLCVSSLKKSKTKMVVTKKKRKKTKKEQAKTKTNYFLGNDYIKHTYEKKKHSERDKRWKKNTSKEDEREGKKVTLKKPKNKFQGITKTKTKQTKFQNFFFFLKKKHEPKKKFVYMI